MPPRAVVVVVITWLAAGCSQILGLGTDPVLDDVSKLAPDAPVDTGATLDAAPGRLWIFKTVASFAGNKFGGNDTPPDVRAATDGICLVTHNNIYDSRACDSANTHAVIHVSSADSLALMATKYHIPTDAPVYRAEDEVLVSNNWNDLIDLTKALRAATSTATSDADAKVWTGTSTSVTCSNWTSNASASAGTLGLTNHIEPGWLGAATSSCDALASLLCICWSAGQQ